jgi:hypothetical protein
VQADKSPRYTLHPGQGGCVSVVLSDLLLFSCLAAFYTGIGLAIANLLN